MYNNHFYLVKICIQSQMDDKNLLHLSQCVVSSSHLAMTYLYNYRVILQKTLVTTIKSIILIYPILNIRIEGNLLILKMTLMLYSFES